MVLGLSLSDNDGITTHVSHKLGWEEAHTIINDSTGTHVSHKLRWNESALINDGTSTHVSHELGWNESGESLLLSNLSWDGHVNLNFFSDQVFWTWLLGLLNLLLLFDFLLDFSLLDWVNSLLDLDEVLLLLEGDSLLLLLLLDDHSLVDWHDFLIFSLSEIQNLLGNGTVDGSLLELTLVLSINKESSLECLLGGLDRLSSLLCFEILILVTVHGVEWGLGDLSLLLWVAWLSHLSSNDSLGSLDGGFSISDSLIISVNRCSLASLVILELLLWGKIISISSLWSEGSVDWVGSDLSGALDMLGVEDWFRDWGF